MDSIIFNSSLKSTSILFFITWIISIPIKNTSIVDLIWGIGYVINSLIGIYYTLYSNNTYNLSSLTENTLLFLFSFIVIFHGFRLSIYLMIRNIGKGEDKRYTHLRLKTGKNFWIVSLITVFLFQLIVNLLVTAPIRKIYYYINTYFYQEDKEYSLVLFSIGLLLSCIGSMIQSVADYQLFIFRRTRKTKEKAMIMTEGLWKYSRHPNYFGEILFFWGLYMTLLAFVTCNNTSLIDFGLLLSSPLTMNLLLVYVSGCALTERIMKKSYCQEYEEYVKRTNMLIPYRII